MKFSCDTQALVESVNIVQKAVASRSTVECLEGIHITAKENKVILCGNNLEICIEAHLEAQVEETGEVVVNSNLFGNIIRKLSGETIDIKVGDKDVTTIKSGNSKFDITGIDSSEFPPFPEVGESKTFVLKQRELKEMISQTIFAVSSNDAKLILTGCYMSGEADHISMVAVDGYRLALKKEHPEEELPPVSMIIPAKTLNELNRIIKDDDSEIRITFSDKKVRFDFENVIFVSRLLEGEYIDYKRIIPSDYSYTVRASVKEMIDAVERVSIVITSEVQKNPIIFHISDGSIKICCETASGKSEEYVAVENTGADLTIGFNKRFLSEALKACTGEEIIMSFVGSVNPCLITPAEGDSYQFLILPVRL